MILLEKNSDYMYTWQDSNLLTDVDLELHAEENTIQVFLHFKLHFAGKVDY
jgi:hypothetical protein